MQLLTDNNICLFTGAMNRSTVIQKFKNKNRDRCGISRLVVLLHRNNTSAAKSLESLHEL